MPFYSVLVEPDPRARGYTTWAPALPGCRGSGETVEAAVADTRAAIELQLRLLAAAGRPRPADAAPHIMLVEVAAPDAGTLERRSA
jgi:predicted RNase H-like HicB family nuclease